MKKLRMLYTTLMSCLCLSFGTAWATLNNLAIYWPNKNGWMTETQQMECAKYVKNHVVAKSEVIFAGYDHSVQGSLGTWVRTHMNDEESDVLILLDMCPAILYRGEFDGSLAETWMENGNMLIWTGSEPFSTYINVYGSKSNTSAGTEGASDVLDVATPGLCRGVGIQMATSAVKDYNISSFREYRATRALKYDQLLIDSLTSDWHHMSYWKVDEVFAEESEFYCSDNIVLINDDGGQFAQFYCEKGEVTGPDGRKNVNYYRKKVIAQFLNNWVSLPCNTLVVPDHYPTIQAAIDAAYLRETVLVKAGTYNEQLDMKKGVKVVSDNSNGGNDLVAGPGYADTKYGVESKKVLRRALRTIIDGRSFSGETETLPMVDFPKGATVGTLLDGFTVRNMPRVDHSNPRHAHAIQFRGASGAIVNCIAHDNGASGLGSHAWFHDEQAVMEVRDFRHSNIQYDAHPLIINNVLHRNEGANIGNNHYSYAIIFNNECFESISVDDQDAPGIGSQHGAHPLIVENLVYKSDWAGIGARKGKDQGAHPINRPTHPIVKNNRVYDSGENNVSGNHGAGIGADDTGGFDPKLERIVYHVIQGNYVNGAQDAAIGCRSSDPDLGYVQIINNEVLNCGRGGLGAGIGLNGATASEIIDNRSHDNNDAGIGIRNGGHADLIEGNEIFDNGAGGIGIADEVSSVGEIRKNVIRNNALAGIGGNGGVTGIYNNIVCGSGTAGITCFVAPVEVINNVVAYSGKAGVVNHTGVPITIKNNICYCNGKTGMKSNPGGYSYNCVYGNNEKECTDRRQWCYYPQYGGNEPGHRDLLDNPLFVDPENHNFRLQDTSPCVDTGDPTILDADGTKSDMGAYGGSDPMP